MIKLGAKRAYEDTPGRVSVKITRRGLVRKAEKAGEGSCSIVKQYSGTF